MKIIIYVLLAIIVILSGISLAIVFAKKPVALPPAATSTADSISTSAR